MSHLWLYCTYCKRVQRDLLQHWKRSPCGPDELDKKKEHNLARKKAKDLTKNAVITQVKLDELSSQEKPLEAICEYVGVTIVKKQGRNTRRRKRQVNI